MCKLYELKNLVSSAKYSEAASYYDKPELRKDFTAWDCYYCSRALQKVGRDNDAIELYKYYKEHFDAQSFLAANQFSGAFGWSVYRTKIKDFDFDTTDASVFKAAVDEVLNECSPSDGLLRWCVIRPLVNAIVTEKRFGDNPDLKLACDYLRKIEPLTLSIDERHIEDGQGIVRYTMSDRESWYSSMTKWLLSLGDFNECIETCDHALDHISDFHNNNDSWFLYRKAKAMLGLGRIDEATKIVNDILKSGFNHWCLHALLFDIFVALGDTEKALMHAGSVLRFQPDYSMCVKLIASLSDFLIHLEDENTGLMHHRLEVALRTEKGWPVTESDLDSGIPAEWLTLSPSDIIARLKPTWNEWSDLGKTFVTGTVSRILPSGNDGFIRCDDGSSYHFFMRDVRGRRNGLSEGTKVKFIITQALDRRRNEMRDSAAEITIL